MKSSARNQLTGTVIAVESGDIVSKVVVRVGDNEMVSIITTDAVEDLDINPGDVVTVTVKSTDVMIMK